jgi:ubiquinone/menaquinone biosynthesis C-methylase UbiE
MSPEAHKFDPAGAHLLDSSERDTFLPDSVLVDLLELTGAETVLDYGVGTGRVAVAVAGRLSQGRVIAVDESPEMVELLQTRTGQSANIEVMAIAENRVALDDASVDRILAVNLLHEVRGEAALTGMRQLLTPGGFLLVVDWDQERPSDPGPPTAHRYSTSDAQQDLTAVGFDVEPLDTDLPYHFVLRARPRVGYQYMAMIAGRRPASLTPPTGRPGTRIHLQMTRSPEHSRRLARLPSYCGRMRSERRRAMRSCSSSTGWAVSDAQ